MRRSSGQAIFAAVESMVVPLAPMPIDESPSSLATASVRGQFLETQKAPLEIGACFVVAIAASNGPCFFSLFSKAALLLALTALRVDWPLCEKESLRQDGYTHP
jgi:hypothetical protein